jgi:hypothetical protein
MYFTTALLRDNQRRFGRLLRQLCELGGFTAGKLERSSKAYQQLLIEQGVIDPEEAVLLIEPVILDAVKGIAAPTYLQVFVWLAVLRKHFESPEFAAVCRELAIPVPAYPLALENTLWKLAGFIPPDEVSEVARQAQGYTLLKIV